MTELIQSILSTEAAAAMRAAAQVEETVETEQVKQSKGKRPLKGKATPKRKKKAPGKKATAKAEPKAKSVREPRVKPAPFEPTDEHLALLDKVRKLIRKNADNIFAIGAAIIPLQEIVPEKSWAKFLNRIGLKVRTAWNYMSVARHLMDDRQALVDADVGPTVLYALARGPRAIVEVVLEAHGRGERLSVGTVRRLVDDALGIKPKEKPGVLDQGGIAGMRRAAAAKVTADTAELARLGKVMLGVIAEALRAAGEGKRLNKGELTARLVADSREAHRLVRSIAAPLEGPRTADAARTGWGRAQTLLDQMSTEPHWPSKVELEAWLTHTVVPTLEFVVHGKSSAPADEVVVDTTAIVEAEAGQTNAVPAVEAEPAIDVDKVEPAAAEEISPEERAAAIFQARDADEPIDVPVIEADFEKAPLRIEVEAPPLAAITPPRVKVPTFLTTKF